MSGELPVLYDARIHAPVEFGYRKARRRELLAKTAGMLAEGVARWFL